MVFGAPNGRCCEPQSELDSKFQARSCGLAPGRGHFHHRPLGCSHEAPALSLSPVSPLRPQIRSTQANIEGSHILVQRSETRGIPEIIYFKVMHISIHIYIYSMYMYIYIYIYMYVYIYICIYIYIPLSLSLYIYVYLYKCTYLRFHVGFSPSIYIHTQVRLLIQVLRLSFAFWLSLAAGLASSQ